MIKVSIIMPAYNAQKYIKESIDSVLYQSLKEWELIIINDGSIDATEDIIKSFDDERIVLISQKNSGVSEARNRGLDIVKGNYVTFLDADDTLPQDSLKDRFEYMESNPIVDLVDGIIHIKDDKLDTLVRTYIPYFKGKLFPELLKLNDKVFFNVCYMIKSSYIKNIRFKKNMTHGEDLLFFIQLSFENNLSYSFINKPIYNYRSGHASAMANLKGLERGYITLIKEVKALNCASKKQLFILKYKICKIMFLSWLSQKKLDNAFFTFFKIFKG